MIHFKFIQIENTYNIIYYYNIFKIENKNVTVRAILNSGNVGNGTKIFNIPKSSVKAILLTAIINHS